MGGWVEEAGGRGCIGREGEFYAYVSALRLSWICLCVSASRS